MKRKNPYERADMEILLLAKTDVLTTSGQDSDVPSDDDIDDNWITP